jgi:hypothetical protein
MTGALYTGVCAVIAVLALLITGVDSDLLKIAFQITGLWIGLLVAAESVPAHQTAA